MDWPVFLAWTGGRTIITVVGFVAILDFTRREAAAKTSGAKQFLSWLGWCLGAALMLSGAFGFAVTLLICLLALVNLGRFLGPDPPAVMSAYAVDLVFVAVGLALYRGLRGGRDWRPRSDKETRSASRPAGGR